MKLSQEKFCDIIGMKRRQYIARFNGEFPTWTLNEIISISKLNEGKVIVDVEGVTYFIDITEVK